MDQNKHRKFFDVQMPGWYRKLAIVLRLVGLTMTVLGGWRFTHPANGIIGAACILFVGIALLLLPSLPKAFIEQRNRIRGLKDGTLQRHLDETDS